ncbi:MAG TPA: FxsA family protein, partial [Hyphomicrobiales bacterium]|nr:FxsA family protein [Hyphomicrobiales bacterium]
MMPLLLPLLLIAVPLIEIALFVVIGGRIGLLATIAVVVVTALAGAALLRIQGLEVIAQARRSAEEGHMPIQPVVDGLFLFAAGLLLLTPGFLTDAIGFLLFVPPLRRRLAAWIWRRLLASDSFVVFTAHTRESGAAGKGRRPPSG